MKSIKSYFQSAAMKERNADKARLSVNARRIYLDGVASLGKAEEVAKTYITRSLVVPKPS